MNSLRDLFPEYFPLTEVKIKKMWEEGIFIPDANALLSLYRYSNATSQDLLKIFTHFKKQLRLPHQAALEFHKNRMSVIYEQLANYDAICAEIDKNAQPFIEKIEEIVTKYPRHPFLNNKNIVESIKKNLNNTIKKIRKQQEDHPKLYEDDTILNEIEDLFIGKVGKAYTAKEIEEITKEGDERYTQLIPPGYKDLPKDTKDKTGKRKYGDLIIWKQMLDFAKKEKKPIIFICDDRKEDWWMITKGRTVGARYELIKEMRDVAGVPFHMYSVSQFIQIAKSEHGLEIDEKTIVEVKKAKQNQEIQNSSFTTSLDQIDQFLRTGNLPKYEGVEHGDISKTEEIRDNNEGTVGSTNEDKTK